MSNSSAGAAAFNAGVQINGVDVVQKPPRTSQEQAYLDAIAAQAEQAVDTITKQIAGMQESLKAAKAEADRARTEAQDGVN